jgi:hypothetical protein
LFPAVLDDYVAEDNPVRAVDVFVDGLGGGASALTGGAAPCVIGREVEAGRQNRQ